MEYDEEIEKLKKDIEILNLKLKIKELEKRLADNNNYTWYSCPTPISTTTPETLRYPFITSTVYSW